MRIATSLLLACAVLAPTAAHATDFTFTGTLSNSATLTGTFTLDSSGDVTAASITGTPRGGAFGIVTYDTPFINSSLGDLIVEHIASSTDNSQFILILPVNFTGGDVCSDSSLCSDASENYSTYYFLDYPYTQLDLSSGTATMVKGTGPTTSVTPRALLARPPRHRHPHHLRSSPPPPQKIAATKKSPRRTSRRGDESYAMGNCGTIGEIKRGKSRDTIPITARRRGNCRCHIESAYRFPG